MAFKQREIERVLQEKPSFPDPKERRKKTTPWNAAKRWTLAALTAFSFSAGSVFLSSTLTGCAPVMQQPYMKVGDVLSFVPVSSFRYKSYEKWAAKLVDDLSYGGGNWLKMAKGFFVMADPDRPTYVTLLYKSPTFVRMVAVDIPSASITVFDWNLAEKKITGIYASHISATIEKINTSPERIVFIGREGYASVKIVLERKTLDKSIPEHERLSTLYIKIYKVKFHLKTGLREPFIYRGTL